METNALHVQVIQCMIKNQICVFTAQKVCSFSLSKWSADVHNQSHYSQIVINV